MNESHGLNDGAIMMDLMVLQSCGYDNQSYKKWDFPVKMTLTNMLDATGNGFFDPQRCFTLHISMPHYYSTSDWWVVVFLWFQSAYSGHKWSSLHVKKCSFHVTLPLQKPMQELQQQ